MQMEDKLTYISGLMQKIASVFRERARMKSLIVLVALVATAQAWGKWSKGLSVRYDIGLFPGRNFFIPIPQTLQAARNSRWVESTRPEGLPGSDLILFTPSVDDVVIGALYDRYGDIAGLQIAIPQDIYSDYPFDWETQGWTLWAAPANSTGHQRDHQMITLYTKKPVEDEEASNTDRIYSEDYVYVTGFNKELVAIPVTASGVSHMEPFKRQNCANFMGRHYFYNVTATSPECTSDQFFPWFTVVDESYGVDQLLGLGLMAFGKLPANQLKRDYFERPSTSFIRSILATGPNCLFGNVEALGGITMHIYFIDSPLLINCIGT